MKKLAALILLLSFLTGVSADEIRPALLKISEQESGLIEIIWKQPARGNRVMSLTPKLPDNFEPLGSPKTKLHRGAAIQVSTYRLKSRDLTGKTIRIQGIEKASIDVLLNVHLRDGTWSAVLKPSTPEYIFPEKQSHWQVGASYGMLGIIHILEGVDHLLFVLALMLLVNGAFLLLKTITAFTLAHSITLVSATLGWLSLPPAPTEALIALSIVFLCVEVLHKHQGKQTLSEQKPWLVAFGFGLVHGLGFAGALSELGVPDYAVPTALLAFNLGVEIGQICFITVIYSVVIAAKRLVKVPLAGFQPVFAYSVGGFAAYWTIERSLAIFNFM